MNESMIAVFAFATQHGFEDFTLKMQPLPKGAYKPHPDIDFFRIAWKANRAGVEYGEAVEVPLYELTRAFDVLMLHAREYLRAAAA
jgi:hypothetical protein